MNTHVFLAIEIYTRAHVRVCGCVCEDKVCTQIYDAVGKVLYRCHDKVVKKPRKVMPEVGAVVQGWDGPEKWGEGGGEENAEIRDPSSSSLFREQRSEGIERNERQATVGKEA